MKITKILCLVFALCLTIAFLPTAHLTDAGNIETNVQVGDGSWFDSGDVKAENGKIIFGQSANATTRIISSKKVSNMKSSGLEKWLDAEFSIKITRVDQGKLFGFAFGLDTPSAKIPSANSNLLALKYNGEDFDLALYSFDKNLTEKTIFTLSDVDAFNKEISFNVYVDVEGGVSLSLDGMEIYNNAEANIDAEGFVGFGQNGKYSAEVGGVRVDAYENATPMNSDVFESFDNGEYNAELLYSQGKTGYIKPSRVVCENGRFLFLNAGRSAEASYNVVNSATDVRTYYYRSTSYISTVYPYSNVDLSFDCEFYGENAGESSGFSIILGRDFSNESTENLKTEAKDLAENIKKDLWDISFKKTDRSIASTTVTGYIELFNGSMSVDTLILPDEFNIFSDENYGKPFSLWLQMIDGNLSIYIKYQDSLAFTKIYTYQMSNTPQGMVQIRANGSAKEEIFSTLGNFSIDNLSVTNFDLAAKKKSVKFRSNIWNTDDFKYEDTWDDSDVIKGGAQ